VPTILLNANLTGLTTGMSLGSGKASISWNHFSAVESGSIWLGDWDYKIADTWSAAKLSPLSLSPFARRGDTGQMLEGSEEFLGSRRTVIFKKTSGTLTAEYFSLG